MIHKNAITVRSNWRIGLRNSTCGELTLPDVLVSSGGNSDKQRLEDIVIKGEVFEAKHTLRSLQPICRYS